MFSRLIRTSSSIVRKSVQVQSKKLSGGHHPRPKVKAKDREPFHLENEEEDEKMVADVGRIIAVAAKLPSKSDSGEVITLFCTYRELIQSYLTLKRRNRGLVSQLTVSAPNYAKLKEELEAKFNIHKLQVEKENLFKEVEYKKIINELVEKNEILAQENEKLRAENKFMTDRIKGLETSVATLSKKIEDIDFQNYIADAYRYLCNGIIAKNSSSIFLKGADCLNHLYSPKDLEYPDDDDYELSEADEKNAEIAAVDEKKKQYANASLFVQGLGLDPTLVRDLRIFNKVRNDDTHDEDCKLKTKKKLTSKKNQDALKELRDVLRKIEPGHAAFHLKSRLLEWCDTVIVENQTSA